MVSKKHQQFGVSLADIRAVNTAHHRLGGRELIVSTKDANNGFGTNTISVAIAMSPEIWMGKINALLSGISFSPAQSVPPNVILEREVVRTPCRYCGTLVDAFRSNKCPSCGAAIH